MIPILLATLPALDRLVRVDLPDHPDRIGGTETASILLDPPEPGTPWRWEPVPIPDGWTGPGAVESTNADLWHVDGVTGAGVKVAVFDLAWFGPGADLAELGPFETHDCWVGPGCDAPMDFTRPFLASEVGIHGFGCAEAVRDVAPEAELHLVRVNSVAGLENGAAWAIRNDIDVISVSMGFYNATFYDGGDSAFDTALTALEANDVLLVASAGNNGQRHWSGPLRDVDADGKVDFDGDGALPVSLKTGSEVVFVNWDQHGRCGDTDLDARLVDDAGIVYGASTVTQDPGADECSPIERVVADIPADGEYRLEVSVRTGTTVGVRLDVILREGTVIGGIPDQALVDPASHPLAFAVGAVRADGYLENGPEPFSAWGPNHAGWPKPDIAGPDGITASVYGPSGFFGTSASAPVVAGLVALVMSDDPSLSPREASRVLQAWAWSGDTATSDPAFGAGKARLPVRDPVDPGCGRRPLLALLLVPPLGWFRRRRDDG